jgi:periplasmic protein TonB
MTYALPSNGLANPSSRTVAVAGGVVALHIAALWALQAGLEFKSPEKVVEVEMVSEILPPQVPQAAPPMPAPPIPKPSPTKPRPQPPAPHAAAPAPKAIADPTPAPNAPVVNPTPPAPPAPAAPPSPPAVAPAPPAPPAPAPEPKIELPSTDADYVNRPAPVYPPMSRRLGEQGKVVLRVQIGADGSALKVELQKSSGFDRLDEAAMTAVKKWRFKPGTRNGVPETMWYSLPINFESNK